MTAPHELPEAEWPVDACGGALLYPCDACHGGFLLLVRTKNRQLCPRCYVEAGRPKMAIEDELPPLNERVQAPRSSRRAPDQDEDEAPDGAGR